MPTPLPLPIALDYRPAVLSPAGIGRATRELAHALADREDLAVHLFAHSLAHARCLVCVPDGAHLHRLPIPGRCLPLLQRLALPAERLAGNVRVFHWTDFVMPPVSRATVVMTVHDLAFVRNPSWHGPSASTLRERTRAAIARAKALIVPSAATAADVQAFAPDAPPAHVVPFGADHVPTTVADTTAHPLGGRPFAVCLGTIEPRKNHRTLLAAWRRLREPRPLLVVVGNIGWQCDDIVGELRAAQHSGDVDWRRAATDEQVFRLLAHAEFLVYPSLWEGFGFPPLEAMQLGVPVVANDIAPMRELGDGAMRLCAAHDAEALATAIETVRHDRALRTRLTAAGRARAAQFRWRDCASAHAAIYHEVAR